MNHVKLLYQYEIRYGFLFLKKYVTKQYYNQEILHKEIDKFLFNKNTNYSKKPKYKICLIKKLVTIEPIKLGDYKIPERK